MSTRVFGTEIVQKSLPLMTTMIGRPYTYPRTNIVSHHPPDYKAQNSNSGTRFFKSPLPKPPFNTFGISNTST